jgi:hypothetical protein
VSNFDEEFTSEDPVLTPPKEPRPLNVEDQVWIFSCRIYKWFMKKKANHYKLVFTVKVSVITVGILQRQIVNFKGFVRNVWGDWLNGKQSVSSFKRFLQILQNLNFTHAKFIHLFISFTIIQKCYKIYNNDWRYGQQDMSPMWRPTWYKTTSGHTLKTRTRTLFT